jgi:hypothetical protein
MVMLTLGTAAPEGSVTVPTMVACCARAASEKTARTTQQSNAVRKGNLLLTERDNLEFNLELIDLTPHPRDFGSATVSVHSEVFGWSAAIPTLRKFHMTTARQHQEKIVIPRSLAASQSNNVAASMPLPLRVSGLKRLSEAYF